MKQVVLCRKDLSDGPDYQVLYKSSFELEGLEVHFAMVEREEVPFDPQHPALARHVLIRKRGFTCNYRDKGIILGKTRSFQRWEKEGFPLTEPNDPPLVGIGSDMVAEVVAVGAEVSELTPGDRVINNGSFPDRHHIPNNPKGYRMGLPTNEASNASQILHCHKLTKIPDQMSDEVAASFTIGGQTSMSMVRRLAIQPGENVLLTAAKSNTSLFALSALAHRKDISLFAASTSLKHADYLRAQGIKEVLLIDQSAQLFRPASRMKVPIYGFDAVIDPFWDIYLSRILPHMAFGGRYVTCGLQDQYSSLTGKKYPTFLPDISETITAAMTKNISILGNCLGRDQDLETAVALHASKQYHVEIDSVYQKAEEIGTFFERTYNKRDRLGKVVFLYT